MAGSATTGWSGTSAAHRHVRSSRRTRTTGSTGRSAPARPSAEPVCRRPRSIGTMTPACGYQFAIMRLGPAARALLPRDQPDVGERAAGWDLVEVARDIL